MGWFDQALARLKDRPTLTAPPDVETGTRPPPTPPGPGTTTGGATGNSTSPTQPIAAFIAEYQRTHPANEGMGPLVAALNAAGYNISPWMYGSTPSRNEINLNGQRYKVIGAEDSGSPYWYVPGTDDGGGGSFGASVRGGAPFTPYDAPAPFNYPGFRAPEPFVAPDKDAVLNDPGYLFRLQEGRRALDASAASRGTLRSGAQGKALVNYGEELGSQEYGKVYDRARTDYDTAYRQAIDAYTADRNNAYGNYALNLQTGQWEWQQNNAGQFQQYQQNYGEGQDQIQNLLGFYQASQPSTAEPPPVPELPTTGVPTVPKQSQQGTASVPTLSGATAGTGMPLATPVTALGPRRSLRDIFAGQTRGPYA